MISNLLMLGCLLGGAVAPAVVDNVPQLVRRDVIYSGASVIDSWLDNTYVSLNFVLKIEYGSYVDVLGNSYDISVDNASRFNYEDGILYGVGSDRWGLDYDELTWETEYVYLSVTAEFQEDNTFEYFYCSLMVDNGNSEGIMFYIYDIDALLTRDLIGVVDTIVVDGSYVNVLGLPSSTLSGADIVGDIVDILVSGITGIGAGIAGGINSFVTALAIGSNNDLSVFMVFVMVFAAIGLGVGLTRHIFGWIESLSGRR